MRTGKKTHIFLRRFILKMIILPRQARDNHRNKKVSKKNTVFLTGSPKGVKHPKPAFDVKMDKTESGTLHVVTE